MRTDNEIKSYIEKWIPFDHHGYIRSFLTEYLHSNNLRRSPGIPQPSVKERIERQISDIMPFAWQCANEGRGLQFAALQITQALLWMIKEEAVANAISEYSFNGKPQLMAVCEHFGIEWQKHDHGGWRNSLNEIGINASEVPAIVLPWSKDKNRMAQW